jgi:hypothetical protein
MEREKELERPQAPASSISERRKLTPAERKYKRELWRWMMMIESERRYRRRTIPVELPEGKFFAHNGSPFDSCGFQMWVQRGSRALVACDCDFGGRLTMKSGRTPKASEIIKHYKIDKDILWKDRPVEPWLIP